MKKFALTSCLFAAGVLMTGCTSAKHEASAPGTASSTSNGTSSAAASTSAPDSSASPSSAASTSGSSAAAPKATALAAMLLKRADFPAGWTSTPYQADPQDAADQAALTQCVGARNTDNEKITEKNSPDFGYNDASVSSSASSYRSQADIDDDVAMLHSSKISTCYEQLAKTQIGTSLNAGESVDAVSFKMTPGSSGGPSNIVATGSGSVTLSSVASGKVTVYISVAFITGPLTEAEVDIENPTQPVPVAFFNDLAQTVAKRAAAGSGLAPA